MVEEFESSPGLIRIFLKEKYIYIFFTISIFKIRFASKSKWAQVWFFFIFFCLFIYYYCIYLFILFKLPIKLITRILSFFTVAFLWRKKILACGVQATNLVQAIGKNIKVGRL